MFNHVISLKQKSNLQYHINNKTSYIKQDYNNNNKTSYIKQDYNNNKTSYIKKHTIIPLNIFQTWYTLNMPEKMKENVELLKKNNPEFTHYLYDDDMCREFIKDNFDEDVLYSFDKLKPGAYKADLWRYCVLYIHGGIYLDIKYRCINGFKLIELTDKEYFVRDRLHNENEGIYQALMIHMPYNEFLLKAIEKITENCKNNIYTNVSELCISGPGLLSSFLYNKEIKSLHLTFNGEFILNNNNRIMECYPGYRNEQNKYQLTQYYKYMWYDKEIYNYPTLQSTKNHIFTRTITKNIMGQYITLYSGTPTIVEVTDNNSYLINIRWINYNYNEDGSKKNIPSTWISMNSKFTVDSNFKKITPEIFLEENFEQEAKYNFWGFGLEDIRVFNYNNTFYYIATYFDYIRKTTCMSSSVYDISNNSYTLKRNIILPEIYDTDNIKHAEKNWNFVEYNNELCIVYKWFPLQIGKVNYNINKMNILDIKYDIPEYFKDSRGSTPGYTINNEIWFVLHKAQCSSCKCYNYQHFFAVFDLDMNLIRYSELFKLGDSRVEFCIGLIVKNDKIILSYSLLDTQSIISEYDIDCINNNIKWYNKK
jgi:mannosyltransferase OCH1-like enzyme